MAKTAIEWAELSWNPLRGTAGAWACVKVSPGCAHCYAERMNRQIRSGPAYLPGQDTPRLERRLLHEPRRWMAPRRIFVCSMSDLFWEAVPDAWIEAIFGEMRTTPRHSYLVLTKRAARMPAWLDSWLQEQGLDAVPPHIWLGTSIENQAMAALRLPELIAIPAAVHWVSCEPLLGPMDLGEWLWHDTYLLGRARDPERRPDEWELYLEDWGPSDALQWVVAGGESGGPPGRRLVEPCDHWWARTVTGERARDCPLCGGTGWLAKPHALDRARSLRDQCQEAGVPFVWKGWGGPGLRSGGRLLDGRLHDAYPRVAAAAVAADQLVLALD